MHAVNHFVNHFMRGLWQFDSYKFVKFGPITRQVLLCIKLYMYIELYNALNKK